MPKDLVVVVFVVVVVVIDVVGVVVVDAVHNPGRVDVESSGLDVDLDGQRREILFCY